MQIGASTNAPAVAASIRFEAAGLADWSLPGGGNSPSGMQRFHRVFLESRRRMFATNNASEGTMWLSPLDTAERDAYIFAKAAIIGASVAMMPALVLRWPPYNRLQKSLTLAGHPDHVAIIGKRESSFGTRTPWAHANHTGTGRAPKLLGGHQNPERPLLDIGVQTRQAYNEAAVDYVQSRLEVTTQRITDKDALRMTRAGRA